MLSLPTLSLQTSPLSKKHPFISVLRDLASQMSETKGFFSFKKEVKRILYIKCCVFDYSE